MQTVTIREAQTQLQHLVKQAQTNHQSVILTDDVADPVAVLTPLLNSKLEQERPWTRRLEILENVVQMWQQHCADPKVSREAAQLFQSQLRQLSTSAGAFSPVFRSLVMLLRLATRQLATPTPSNQVQALAQGLVALGTADLSWLQVEQVDQGFLASGIHARANFSDEELLKAYIDAS